MLQTVTLPTLVLLAALPGFLKFGGGRKPAVAPTAADSLPPVWRHASRLALENLFVRGTLPGPGERPPGIHPQAAMDQRRERIRVEPDSGLWVSTVDFADVPLGQVTRLPLAEYADDAMERSFRRQWSEQSRTKINSLGANTPATRTGGLQIKLPEVLPSRVRSVLGPGGPALNVRGAENIRISGQSNWTNQQLGQVGQRRSLFPSLDMQQDLDIQLEGQLSDRVKVNLLQNSANQIPLANRIAINYRGDEDDLVQALDLGNTSLSLPGTQYVSYSGKNEGLFGVKLASRLGPLDFTALASRQEGKSERSSFTGGASSDSRLISDLSYAKGQYFLLYDPNFQFANGDVPDIPDEGIRIYYDDGNANNDIGVLRGKAVLDPDGLNHVVFPPGADPDTSYRGSFELLERGADKDYEILRNLYFVNGREVKVIRLKRAFNTQASEALAAAWVQTTYNSQGQVVTGPDSVGGRFLGNSGPDSARVLLKLIRPPRSLFQKDPQSDNFDRNWVFNLARELEMKNFYQLPGANIDRASFKLSIRRGQDDPPVTSTGGSTPVPYLEVAGLDNLDENTAPAQPGHDGKLDGTSVQAGVRLFLDDQNGVLFFYEPRPFAPRIARPDSALFDGLLSRVLNRRAAFTGATGGDTEPNDGIYDLYNPRIGEAERYYLDVEYTAGRSTGEIALGRTNITEGSETVRVNGQEWRRDVDYRIDYDFGRVTLIRQLGATDQLSVDYAYAPLFAQAGRTLIGSAFRLEGREKHLGGAFLYEAKGAQDLRPRLGEEPSRTLITDVNSAWKFKPAFLTRAVDRLPFVRATVPSDLSVEAEVGASFPNPNTRNEVYIDDMEGVRDAQSLSMDARSWRWSNVPSRATSVTAGIANNPVPLTAIPGMTNAEVHWFSPTKDVREIELRPDLEDAQTAQSQHSTLAISVPRYPTTRAPGERMWVGLTYLLDPVGIDLSRSQFLEVWVNDFNDYHDKSSGLQTPRVRANDLDVKLHIDIGVVGEDQMRAPNRPPNDLLDSEDRNKDGQLAVTDDRNEDTGYDGRRDPGGALAGALGYEDAAARADLTTASDRDPEGDDYAATNATFESELDPARWATTNGIESNSVVRSIPDTEDMNNNGALDNAFENYFQYTISLADSATRYKTADIQLDFDGDPDVSVDNGWRRYRIPLTDSARVAFGSPDLTLARHVRIWIEGLREGDWQGTNRSTGKLDGRPVVMLGGLDIVGSRWQSVDLTPAQRDTAKTTLTLNAVNSIDNTNIYSPPFDPGRQLNGNQEITRREQSIAMEFTEFQPEDTLEAYKSFSIDENYSRYGALRWYQAGFDLPQTTAAAESLWMFVRFASDDRGLNYYEYKRRVPNSTTPRSILWDDVRVPITAMSNLKLASDFPVADPILYRAAFGDGGDSIVIRGRPSFTRLRRISFGLVNAATVTSLDEGQVWFNELRATDVAKDLGVANRIVVGGTLSNLARYNLVWNAQGADFLSVGQTRGTGNRTSNVQFTSGLDLHRFIEGTGIQLPVSYSFTQNVLRPRFNAGDDVVRSEAASTLSETRSTNQSVSASYARTWSERSNPFLRFALSGLTANLQHTRGKSTTPTGLDSSVSTSGGVAYSLAPRQLLKVPVPFTKSKLFLLPDRMYWNYSIATRNGQTFQRPPNQRDTLVLQNETRSRTAGVDFGADSRPFDFLRHHIEGRRNLALDNYPVHTFLNAGRNVSWAQSLDANYSSRLPSVWLKPNLTWNAGYRQNNGPELSPDLRVLSISNSQSASMQWQLPFDQLVRPGARPVPVAPPDSTGAARRAFRLDWREVARRVGNVSTSARWSRNTAYGRLRGTPSVGYLFGLSENPGFAGDSTGRVVPQLGNQSSVSMEWSSNASTNIVLGWGSSINTSVNYRDRTARANTAENRSRDWTWPNAQLEYGQIAQLLQLTRWIQTPSLRTSFQRGTQVEYQNGKTVETSRAVSTQWEPLLSLAGSLRNGTRTELSISRRSSDRLNTLQGRTRQTEATTNVRFSLNRTYSQGQKVTFLGRTSTVKSNVTLGLTGEFSSVKGETVDELNPLALPISPRNEDRLNLNSTGSYDFSTNVRGTATLGFTQTRRLEQDQISRSIRVEVQGRFSF